MDSRKYNSQDITSKLDEIKEAIEAGGLAPSVIADAYSDEETYSVGDYVTYNAKSYRCTTAVTEAEEFDPEKWEEVKVLDELASAVELPPVTSTDNGKILSVVGGEWSKASNVIDKPTAADEGKYLTVTNQYGKIGFANIPKLEYCVKIPANGTNTSGPTSFMLSNSDRDILKENQDYDVRLYIMASSTNAKVEYIFRKVRAKGANLTSPVPGYSYGYYVNIEEQSDDSLIYRYFSVNYTTNNQSPTVYERTIGPIAEPTTLRLFCESGSTNLRVHDFQTFSGKETWDNILARYTAGNLPITVSFDESDDPDQVYLNCYAKSVPLVSKTDNSLCFSCVSYVDTNYSETISFMIQKEYNTDYAIVYANSITIGESS